MLKQNRKKHLISHARNKKPMKKDQPKTVKSTVILKMKHKEMKKIIKFTKWPKVIKKIINSRKKTLTAALLYAPKI